MYSQPYTSSTHSLSSPLPELPIRRTNRFISLAFHPTPLRQTCINQNSNNYLLHFNLIPDLTLVFLWNLEPSAWAIAFEASCREVAVAFNLTSTPALTLYQCPHPHLLPPLDACISSAPWFDVSSLASPLIVIQGHQVCALEHQLRWTTSNFWPITSTTMKDRLLSSNTTTHR